MFVAHLLRICYGASMPLPKNIQLPKALRDYYAKEGKRGGKARAKNMTAEERIASARKASQARWAKIDVSLKEMKSNLAKLERKSKAGAARKKPSSK